MTPYLRSSFDSISSLKNAPRTLKEPVFCKDSSLRKMFVPINLENVSDLCNGVFLTTSFNKSLALNICSIVGNSMLLICTTFISGLHLGSDNGIHLGAIIIIL